MARLAAQEEMVGALEAAPRELTDRLGVLEVAPAGLERNGIPPTPPI